MSIDLRHAGLGEDAEQRIRLAASAMAAHHFAVVVSAWDGTRCSILVADADDAYGRAAMSAAQRRGVPVVALASGAHADDLAALRVQKTAPVAVLVKAIEQSLPAVAGRNSPEGRAESRAPEPTHKSNANGDIGLVRLALRGVDDAADLRGSISGRSFLFSRRAARARSTCFSDLLVLESKLCEPGWSFEPLHEGSKPPGYEIGASFDSVCVNAAFLAADRLPRFRDGYYWMGDWPDLGRAFRHPLALRVAHKLHQGRTSFAELEAATGAQAAGVNACFWAFSALGLLKSQSQAEALGRSEPQRRVGGMVSSLLGRMAKRFGYVREHDH